MKKLSKRISRDFSFLTSHFSPQKGFTLIELLIVIAILGILTTAVLVAINPNEQFARSRDAGRKNLIDQLGHALQGYYTAQNSTYPTSTGNNTWMTTLQATSDIKTVPDNNVANNNLITPCPATSGLHNNICYNQSANTDAVIYAVQASVSEQTKASCTAAGNVTYVVWSSYAGRTGLWCGANNTTYPPVGAITLL